jgi:hypothetical protein
MQSADHGWMDRFDRGSLTFSGFSWQPVLTVFCGPVREELSKDKVGYLLCHSRVLEQPLDYGGPDFIKRIGTKAWFHVSDHRSRDAVKQLKQIGIPSFSNYSAGELAPIAYEYTRNEGYYHVAHTNVIVERDYKLTTTFDGVTVGRLLITHLHSYATPLIRYDIGDFDKLQNQCPSGHDGPTISHIYGRGKALSSAPRWKISALLCVHPAAP